ncbi:VOC family protein [Amycolatopsis sp. NPDC049252]|uniref:VOC family protein n=1 Tax=Amycolatopsis sp. NPDC049252 TaxID=3363933 RepID=UPI0037129C60
MPTSSGASCPHAEDAAKEYVHRREKGAAMLGSADLVAFAPSTDLERSRTFYTDVAGLEFIEQSPFACVFRSGGTMLRVTAVPEFTPHPFTVLGWAVADIHTSVAELRARGVEFLTFDNLPQDTDKIWTTPGGRIAWFRDPDGNVLSLTEFTGH